MSVLLRQTADTALGFASRLAGTAANTFSKSNSNVAAVRVERSKSADASQSAVTMWFGEGPSLPSPGTRSGKEALRIGAGILAAISLGAMAAIAGQTDENRTRLRASRARLIVPPTKERGA